MTRAGDRTRLGVQGLTTGSTIEGKQRREKGKTEAKGVEIRPREHKTPRHPSKLILCGSMEIGPILYYPLKQPVVINFLSSPTLPLPMSFLSFHFFFLYLFFPPSLSFLQLMGCAHDFPDIVRYNMGHKNKKK